MVEGLTVLLEALNLEADSVRDLVAQGEMTAPVGITRDGGPTSESAGARHGADGDELAVARELLALHQDLSAIASQSADAAAVTELLADRLDAPVWLISETLALIASSGADFSDCEEGVWVHQLAPQLRWDRILQVASETRWAVSSPETDATGALIVVPVLVDLKVAAYLLTMEPKRLTGNEFTRLALEHGATICGIILNRGRPLTTAAGQARNDLVEGLLVGRTRDAEELNRWARHVGIDPTATHRLMLFTCGPKDPSDGEPTPERQARVNEMIKHFCESRGVGVLTLCMDGEVVALAPETPSKGLPAKRLATECLAYCSDLFADVRVTAALSKSCPDTASIALAYRDVRRTMSALVRLARQGEVVTLDDLGLHRLLLQLPDLQELRSFAEEMLGALARYDRSRGTQLLETLIAFFHHEGSVRRMAEHLHVHPNTITHRLKRIADLGQFDLREYADRLAVQVALEIFHLLGPIDG